MYAHDVPDACADLCQRIGAKYPRTHLLVVIDRASQAAEYFPAGSVCKYLLHWTSSDELIECIDQILRNKLLLDATVEVDREDKGPLMECPHGPDTSALLALTARQQIVLSQLIDGRSNAEIARALSLSIAGVKWHLTGIYSTFGLRNRGEVVAFVLRKGLDEALLRQTRDPSGAKWRITTQAPSRRYPKTSTLG
ncbi:MAG: LuxR C-terminal-related transcriptional regulator, partial [Candidatus Marsarchaeota archaeon]|nr:LuxR C-terminal-related transcriptional regulator [Candidatus Marsarchaeota archaeon]